MKTLNLSILFFISMVTLTLTSCENNSQQASKDSENQQELNATAGERKVIFDNDYAQVVSITLAQGEFISPPEGKGKDRVVYSLSDYTLDWDQGGGEMITKTWKQNDVHFHEAGSHYVKNTGNAVAEYLVFVKKTDSLPECDGNTIENDIHSITPNFSENLFENEDFKVTKVNLLKGDHIPMHSGMNRVIYSLNDYQINYETGEAAKTEKTFQKGNIHWHESCEHAIENIGDAEAIFLVVSYKKKL